MSVINPEIDELLARVGDEKYALCIISAKRARQINEMIHGVRDQALLSTMATSEIAKITSTKPLSLALDEISSGDIGFDRPEDSYK